MKSVFFLPLFAVILVASSCTKDRVSGNGSTTTEDRSLNNFTKINAMGSTDAVITKGTSFKVQVKGSDNLVPYFETKVVNGTLNLGYKNDVHVRHDDIQVFITMPALNGLKTQGSGNITSSGNFTDVADFETSISGSGNITIEQGSARNFSSTISGSGDVHAFGFSAEKANIRVSGSGNTRITATNQLDVKIAGSGNVYYKGTPQVSVNISGSGSVIKQ
jgi:hypothetical protein